MPKLLVTLPDGSNVTHELTDDTITVGRVSDNTIQIEDASVSSYHAELTLRDADYVLRDLGSTNGTRLNGNKVEAEEEHQLQPGDRLRFGSIEVRYGTDLASGQTQQPLPMESEPVSRPAASSSRPADFANASPFQKKGKKKDPTGAAMMAVGAFALLVCGAALAMIFQMQPPQ